MQHSWRDKPPYLADAYEFIDLSTIKEEHISASVHFDNELEDEDNDSDHNQGDGDFWFTMGQPHTDGFARLWFGGRGG